MKKSKKIILTTSLALTLFGAGFATTAGAKEKNFEAWLEKYGAWDILAESYSDMEESPDLIMKRAETAYMLGRYSASLKTLQGTPAFSDNATETKRLWLGGKALRASGRPEQAFIWFSQSAKLMNKGILKDHFKDEPRFKSFWFDVWRNLYWSYLVTPPPASEARRMILDQSLSQAAEVWPSTYFVLNTKPSWSDSGINSSSPQVTPVNATMVTDTDRDIIARSLAATSLGATDQSRSILEDVSNSTVKNFWKNATSVAETGITPKDIISYKKDGLIHPWAFFASGALSPALSSDTLWKLPDPPSTSWTVFRKKLMGMPPKEALKTIDRETGSLLLSGDLVNALQNYKLAFGFLSGDMEQAHKAWINIDPSALPLSLRLAGGIAFKEPFNKMLSPKEAGREEIYFIVSGLCSAAGLEYFPGINAPFWEEISQKSFNKKVNSHPLDRMLLFAELDSFAKDKLDSETARRSAYLFPDSRLGTESFIELAREASSRRDFKLAGFYLKHIDPRSISEDLKLKWLVAKAEYELSVGDEARAMKSYREILASGGKLAPEKELKLALLIQQKGDKRKAQAILKRIWKDHEKLDSELQAEILFWIAEGEYAMGNKDKSLKLYLELAWKYPGENIWAVTAMYRSSMIYEVKGQFDTAKRLLKTVIKRADRKSQKEAAKARMNAIDSKMAKAGVTKGPAFPY